MSELAKVMYRPVALFGSLIAGTLAAALVKEIWQRAAGEDDAPDPLHADSSLRRVLLAAALQGLVFAVIKAVIDRGSARVYERVTGEWPGDAG